MTASKVRIVEQLLDDDDDDVSDSIKPDNLTIRNVWKADYPDIPSIEKLVTPDTQLMYNLSSVFNKVHYCSVSHVLKDLSDHIVAAVCLADFPNILSIPSDDWFTWINRIYGIKDTNSFNSFWIHLVVFDPLYADTFLQILIRFIFEEHNKKNYVLFVVPYECQEKVEWLNEYSTTIVPIGFSYGDKVQTLRLLVRQDFVTNYKIRRAVEEDNDDLVPLIDAYSRRLVDIYGEFYIAEIVTRHPDAGRHVIVAEYKGLAVSVLCLNERINYTELNQAFQLDVFSSLCKEFSSEPKLKPSLSYTHIYEQELMSKLTLPTYASTMVDGMSQTNDMDILYEKIYLDFDDLSIDLSFSLDEQLSKKSSVQREVILTPVVSYSRSDTDEDLEDVEQNVHFVEDSMDMSEGNAFVIEIAAAHSDHEFSLCLLLEAAFECFPDKDYCLLTLPSEQEYFPLLNMFIRVTPKKNCFHPHELYLVHKVMLNVVSIKSAREPDVELIRKFNSYLKWPGTVFQKFVDNLEKPHSKLRTYMLITGNFLKNPCGVVMINEMNDVEFIKQKYSVHNWTLMKNEKNSEVGVIEYFCLSPLFRKHTKFFLRELHRKSGYSTLFYGINRYDCTSLRARPMPSILGDLYPVPPRKICIEGGSKLNVYEEEPFALYITTSRLTSVQKIDINNRIVVVGASYAATSFLRGLLFSKYGQKIAIFNNVMVVSSHGLCHKKPPNPIRDKFFTRTSIIDYDYMIKTNLRCYVSVIKGTMTAINRTEKTITVNKRLTVSYDKLFLMCGVQYNVPRKEHVKEYLKVKQPPNMYTINTLTDATSALKSLKTLTRRYSHSNYTIVVYGFALEVYCCIATLLEYGVPADHISLVEPYPPERDGELHHDFIFQDGDIYEVTVSTVKDLGVNMYTGYKLIDWVTVEDKISLKMESKLRYLEIDALAVFVYPEKTVNKKAYKAIFDAGLVFDGRLVITPDCRTNDPHIYATGSLTKYSRRYYADHLCHKYFNHEEIGELLGKKIRASLLPYTEDTDLEMQFTKHCWSTGEKLVPVYEKPLITYCILPGDMHYLHVCKPGVTVPLETAMSDDDYGSVLTTGSCNSMDLQGYFRIHLSTNKIVTTITCLSLQPFDYRKIILLWGKHETMLNNLMKRFEMLYIADLFQYFEAPWCNAIFHDDFPLFEKDMMKIMMSKTSGDHSSPLEDFMQFYKATDYKELGHGKKSYIMEKFKNSPYETMLIQNLLDFIRDNLTTLDVYAHPVLINYILAGYKESPLFKEV